MAPIGSCVLMQHAPGVILPGACCAWVLRSVPLWFKGSHELVTPGALVSAMPKPSPAP